MEELRFSHLALNCHDLAAVERYYTRNFGFQRARAIPVDDGEIVFLRCGGVYLELFAAEVQGGNHNDSGVELPEGAGSPRTAAAAQQGPGDGPGDGPHHRGVRHLAFQVADIDVHLQRMGGDATITLGPLEFDEIIPDWRTVWLRDPEGNIVEVSQGFRDQEDLSVPGMMPAERRAAGSSPEERNNR